MAYRIDTERAITALYSFNERTRDLLRQVIQGVTDRIAERERAKLGGHADSGSLAGSVTVSVRAFRDRLVGGQVTVGGTRRTPHANLFERGIDRTQPVPAHQRTSPLGKKFSVRAYEMKFQRPAHEFLSDALRSETPRGREEVAAAIDAAAREAGLQ